MFSSISAARFVSNAFTSFLNAKARSATSSPNGRHIADQDNDVLGCFIIVLRLNSRLGPQFTFMIIQQIFIVLDHHPPEHYFLPMQTQPTPSTISPPPPPFSEDFLANPKFRAMVRNELSDILTDFIVTQEKRASDVSLIERIVRVEEAQRSHEQLTRALLEQMNLRFEEMQRNMDKRFEGMQQTMDKRFEAMQQAMDKRFEAIQQSMDKRFEAVDKRFEAIQQSMDKRFEAMDNRFKELGRRLDRFMFWSLGLTVSATFLIITMLR